MILMTIMTVFPTPMTLMTMAFDNTNFTNFIDYAHAPEMKIKTKSVHYICTTYSCTHNPHPVLFKSTKTHMKRVKITNQIRA